MSTLSCVVGLKTTKNETKIKVALITSTEVGKKPAEVIFNECVLPSDVRATATKVLNKIQQAYPDASVDFQNGLYVSQSTGKLTETDALRGETLNTIESVLKPVFQTQAV